MTSSVVLLLSLLSLGLCCEDVEYSAIDVSFKEQLNRADIVLYGKDVTPMEDCQGASSGCGRRDIVFEVYCILKSDGGDIDDQIEIGFGELSACAKTFFTYEERDELIVLIKRLDNDDGYDWHEISYNSLAKFNASQVDWDDLKSQCELDIWTTVEGADKECPARGDASECEEGPACRGPGWAYIGGQCYWASNSAVTVDEAISACGDMDSELMAVKSTDQFDDVLTGLPPQYEERTWWSRGLCTDDHCNWDIDMSECCLDNGVPEACLGLCSTQYALWSRSVMNIPECLFALPTIFQCGIGPESQRECCIEQFTESSADDLNDQDELCLQYCDLVQGSDPTEVLNVTNLAQYEECGNEYYMTAATSCWRTDEQEDFPTDNWHIGPQVGPSDATEGIHQYVLMGHNGFTTGPDDDTATNHFICQKDALVVLAPEESREDDTSDEKSDEKSDDTSDQTSDEASEEIDIEDYEFDTDIALLFKNDEMDLGNLCCKQLSIEDRYQLVELDADSPAMTLPASLLKKKPHVLFHERASPSTKYTLAIGILTRMELRNTDDNSTEMVSGAFIHYLGVEISPANTKGVDIVEWNPVVYGIEKHATIMVSRQMARTNPITADYFNLYNTLNDRLVTCHYHPMERCFAEPHLAPEAFSQVGITYQPHMRTQLMVQLDPYGMYHLIVEKGEASGRLCQTLWPETEIIQGEAACDYVPSVSSCVTESVTALIAAVFTAVNIM